jgi:hypothetical protein
MRFLAAIALNLLMPGAGLIALGRLWTGLLAAVLYTICAGAAIVGSLLAPASVPVALTIGGGGLAGATWLLAQWMLWDRLRTLRDPALASELAVLRAQATTAIERNDLQEARGLLAIALSIDPDALDTVVLWARLSAALGRFREARRAWRLVSRSGDAAQRREAVNAIERLPR